MNNPSLANVADELHALGKEIFSKVGAGAIQAEEILKSGREHLDQVLNHAGDILQTVNGKRTDAMDFLEKLVQGLKSTSSNLTDAEMSQTAVKALGNLFEANLHTSYQKAGFLFLAANIDPKDQKQIVQAEEILAHALVKANFDLITVIIKDPKEMQDSLKKLLGSALPDDLEHTSSMINALAKQSPSPETVTKWYSDLLLKNSQVKSFIDYMLSEFKATK